MGIKLKLKIKLFSKTVVRVLGSTPKDGRPLVGLEVRLEPFDKGVSRAWAQTQDSIAS